MRKVVLGVVIGVALAGFAGAQDQPQGPRPSEGGMRGPRYDASKEVTLQGTIEDVKEMAGRSGRTSTGIVLKTDKETIEIRLAPAEFLAEKKLTLAKGDNVQVIGAKTSFQDREVFRVREIKKGDVTVTLIDSEGRPAYFRPQQ